VKEFKAPRDHEIRDVKWGPLDKSLYYGTDHGRLVRVDFETEKIIKSQDVHRHEIFTLTMTKHFCMLFTCSRDGLCKLLHPETF